MAERREYPAVISERHPLRWLATKNPIWLFISKNIPLAFIVSEFFYSAWMSCVAVNLIVGFSDIDRSVLVYAISAAYMVNIIWGLIDGGTYVLGRNIFTSEEDRAIIRLMKDRDDERAKKKLMESLDSGPVAHLCDEDKEKVVDMILTSGPDVHPNRPYRFHRRDIRILISFLIIDVVMATLTVLPFVLMTDMSTAMIISRAVTISMFACVAYVSAKHLNRNWIFWVAVLSALAIAVSQMTWLYS